MVCLFCLLNVTSWCSIFLNHLFAAKRLKGWEFHPEFMAFDCVTDPIMQMILDHMCEPYLNKMNPNQIISIDGLISVLFTRRSESEPRVKWDIPLIQACEQLGPSLASCLNPDPHTSKQSKGPV